MATIFHTVRLRAFSLLQVLVLVLSITSCVDEDQLDDTPQGNFEALWKIMDEHYCFFEEKGIDWQQIHDKYKVRVNSGMSKLQLFEVMADMLSELRDGHVNLTAAHDFARNWSWYENYPANISDTLLRSYMGTDYKIASGLKYRILDDNIGYIRYESFIDGIGEGNLDEVLIHMLLCRGIIIDIRDNGGGELTNAQVLASRFCNKKTLVGYTRHKTGAGHNDFSEMEPHYLEPSANVRWQKGVCVLTNRHVYSAANDFVMMMKALPGTILVGDRTGGGGGMPFSSTLPNGWVVRFSAVPSYDANRKSVEFGISPDYDVNLTDADFLKGEDTLIEFARQILVQ